jgi:hypothetical protein
MVGIEDELTEDGKRKLKKLTPEFLNSLKGIGCSEIMNMKSKPTKEEFGEVYELIIQVLKRYCDLDERYYSLIAIWIIGTYTHNDFPSYPYLFFNAMKGSGKSRLLRLICYLSKDGCMLNSLTEAVMFRTKGTLGIDEFEGLNRKGKEALSELLNSAYKKGIKVKRMKKVKTFSGEEQQVEEFDVYRPIILANISGMDSVLADRCFTIILNKSNKPGITKRVELFEKDEDIHFIKEFPFEKCSRCSVDVLLKEYNYYLDEIYNTTTLTTLTTYPTLTTLTTLQEKNLSFFNKLNDVGIDGRNLELSISLLIIANSLSDEIFNELIKTFQTIVEEKKKEDVVENLDVSLLDYLSQEVDKEEFVAIRDIFNNFKGFVRIEEDWFNEKWMGRALKRLGLIKEKKRMNYGVIIKLDYKKSQDKIRMFK